MQERRPKSVLKVLVDECGNGSHFGTFAAVLHFTSSHHFPGLVMSFEVLHLMHPWCDDHQSVRLMAVASETSRFGERSHVSTDSPFTPSMQRSKKDTSEAMMQGVARSLERTG